MLAMTSIFVFSAQAASISPTLQNQLTTLADNVSVGMVIVSFNTNNGLQQSHLNVLRSVGVTGGQTFPILGMVAQPMTVAQVRALAGNAQIPGALRGYVQVAIDKGLFEAFPAQIIQIAPGQFQALPGPRFEPNANVSRATFASKLNLYRQLFSIGG